MEKQESPFPNPPSKPEGEASPPGEKISALTKQESLSPNRPSKLEGEGVLQRAPRNEIIASLLEIEKMRTDMINRQTEVSRMTIEAQNLADERQFTFVSRRLEYEKEVEEKRISAAAKIVWGLIAVFALPFFFALLMFFFGNDANREGAKGVLVYGWTALAGWGAISAIKIALGRILPKQSNQD